MSNPSVDSFRYDINALRAIAIIGVVAYHYGITGFSGGFVGVDTFFVISGFLISSHIQRDLVQNRFSFASFYVSRMRRIFPALAVMCIACAIWGWFYSLPKDYLAHSRHGLEALLFVSNYAFNDERGYFAAASHSKPLLHTWSLSVEGQFYLFLPLLLMAIWKYAHSYYLLIIGFVFLLSLTWCLYYSQVDAGAAFYQLATRVWEFMAGTLLALSAIKKPKTLWANIGSVAGLALLILSIGWFNAKLLWPSYYTLAPILGSVLLIASGEARATSWCFNSWLLQRLGDISYSLYLWHWPVWVFAKLYVNNRLERELLPFEIIGLIGLALILALISWWFVEKPIRFKKGWWSNRRIWQTASATLSVFIVFTILAAINKGFSNRLPDYIQRGFAAVALNTPRGECFRNEASIKQASEQFCQFGVSNQVPSLLLWGDSHANMYLTALSNATSRVGKTGYIATQTGCRATLPNQPNDLTGAAGLACTVFNNEVNVFIANNPNIQTIIIARMWIAGESFNRTLQLINQLVEQGKQVIVVGPVPYLAFSVPEHWIYQQLKAGQAIDNLTDPSSHQQSLFDLQQQAKQQLNTSLVNGRIIWIDPLKKLCPARDCLLVAGGMSYFKDVTHLSEAGAMLFTDNFAQALALQK